MARPDAGVPDAYRNTRRSCGSGLWFSRSRYFSTLEFFHFGTSERPPLSSLPFISLTLCAAFALVPTAAADSRIEVLGHVTSNGLSFGPWSGLAANTPARLVFAYPDSGFVVEPGHAENYRPNMAASFMTVGESTLPLRANATAAMTIGNDFPVADAIAQGPGPWAFDMPTPRYAVFFEAHDSTGTAFNATGLPAINGSYAPTAFDFFDWDVSGAMTFAVERIIICSQPPIFTRQPVNEDHSCDRALVLTVQAPLASSFRWLFNGQPLSDGPIASGAGIAGATSPTLVIDGVTAAQSGIYTCEATNACGSSASLPAFISVFGCPCDPDYNSDGAGDIIDILNLANDIASGTQSFPPSITDFNNDGSSDTADILDLVNVITGGDCP